MKFLIIGVFAAIVAVLIWRSKQNTAPEEQACVFQTKVATDSRRSLPPIPRESCH